MPKSTDPSWCAEGTHLRRWGFMNLEFCVEIAGGKGNKISFDFEDSWKRSAMQTGNLFKSLPRHYPDDLPLSKIDVVPRGVEHARINNGSPRCRTSSF